MCYAFLHPDDQEKAELALEHQHPFLTLKAIVGAIAAEGFNQYLKMATPPAFFHAMRQLYAEGVAVHAKSVFQDLLEIGRTHEKRLGVPHILWARDLTLELVSSKEYSVKMWVRAVCDPPDYSTDLNWDDPEESVMGPTWCAPQLITMRPSRNSPYIPTQVWDRLDREMTKSYIKSFAEMFTIHIKIRIDDLANDETVKLAKQPKPDSEKPADSVRTDLRDQEAKSPSSFLNVKKAYRKLKTAERNRKIVAEFQRLEKMKPNKPSVWYSEQLAKSEVAAGLDAETIRKIIRN